MTLKHNGYMDNITRGWTWSIWNIFKGVQFYIKTKTNICLDSLLHINHDLVYIGMYENFKLRKNFVSNLRKTTRLKFLGNSKKNIKYRIIIMILSIFKRKVYKLFIRDSKYNRCIKIEKNRWNMCSTHSFKYSKIKYVWIKYE